MKKLKIVIFFIIFLSVIFIINRNYCNAIDMKKMGIGERAKIEVYTSNTSVTWIIEDESIVKRTGFSMGSSCQRLYIQALKEGTTNIYCYINGSVIFQQIIEVRNEFALDLTQDMNNYTIVWDKIKPINFGMPSKVEYTGTPIEPKIQIEFNNVYLQEGRDYVVKYENNIEVGTAKIIVTGINSCTGKKIIEFYIVKSTIEPEPNPEPEPQPEPQPETNQETNQETKPELEPNTQTKPKDEEKPKEEQKPKEEEQSQSTEPKKEQKEDNTIARGSLPKAGLKYGIITIINLIVIASIFFYKKHSNLKDIK